MGNIFFNYKVGNQYLTEDITIPFLIIIGIYLAVVITFYVFRSIGLYVLAKRNGVKKAFLAWIPFLWINIACKLAGDFRIFSKKISELTLLFTILFTVGEVLSLFYMFLDYFPLIGYFLSGGSIYFGTAPTIEHLTYSSSGLTGTYVLSNYVNPYASIDFTLFYAIIETLDIITMILSLVTIFIKVNVFISIFRKFWPQHFILASIFSLIDLLGWLPVSLFGVFIFAIRKRTSIDYASYVRAKRENYYRQYGNPYESQNNYQSNQRPQQPKEEPFGEFKNSKDEPFSDFFDNKNGDK